MKKNHEELWKITPMSVSNRLRYHDEYRKRSKSSVIEYNVKEPSVTEHNVIEHNAIEHSVILLWRASWITICDHNSSLTHRYGLREAGQLKHSSNFFVFTIRESKINLFNKLQRSSRRHLASLFAFNYITVWQSNLFASVSIGFRTGFHMVAICCHTACNGAKMSPEEAPLSLKAILKRILRNSPFDLRRCLCIKHLQRPLSFSLSLFSILERSEI